MINNRFQIKYWHKKLWSIYSTRCSRFVRNSNNKVDFMSHPGMPKGLRTINLRIIESGLENGFVLPSWECPTLQLVHCWPKALPTFHPFGWYLHTPQPMQIGFRKSVAACQYSLVSSLVAPTVPTENVIVSENASNVINTSARVSRKRTSRRKVEDSCLGIY